LRQIENPYDAIRYEPYLNAFTVGHLIDPEDNAPMLFSNLEAAMQARDLWRVEVTERQQRKRAERQARKNHQVADIGPVDFAEPFRGIRG